MSNIKALVDRYIQRKGKELEQLAPNRNNNFSVEATETLSLVFRSQLQILRELAEEIEEQEKFEKRLMDEIMGQSKPTVAPNHIPRYPGDKYEVSCVTVDSLNTVSTIPDYDIDKGIAEHNSVTKIRKSFTKG